MFTGIVECTGKLLECRAIDGGARFRIALPFAAELQLGDSVAVNGCCLTVDELGDGCACFDLLQQTLRVTSLGDLTVGSLCNLERAMLPTTRLGGHFVSGHIDVAGTLLDISPLRARIARAPAFTKPARIVSSSSSVWPTQVRCGTVGMPRCWMSRTRARVNSREPPPAP